MNTGIQILIERMKTNPEEWAAMTTRGRGKWEAVIVDYWDYLTEEDQNAYKAARDALLQEQFTEVVMKKLAGVGDDDGVALTSVSHNDINPLMNSKIRMQGRIDPYQNNPYQGMGQQPLRVGTQSDDSNSLYSVPSLQKDSKEGNLLSQIAKRMGRK
jgi:hypothetical protein